MAKWKDIEKGVRARKRTSLPLRGVEVPLDVRVLGPWEDIDIASAATRFAKEKGVENPARGNDIYDAAERAHTLLRACIDAASPEDAPEPFFGSLEEILNADALQRDHIAYLFEEQATFQDECSPLRRDKLTIAEYTALVVTSAGDDIRPFAMLAPVMQWAFVRTMATQLINSPTDRLPSTSPPSPESTDATPEASETPPPGESP